ncbi:MAG: c-type cytochrome [Hyphomicrobiales bacterium]|nr:c-type cytochrome [Hyphomicrobiales bacterium]
MATTLNGECRTVSAQRGAMHSPPARSSSILSLSARMLAIVVALPLALIGCEEEEDAGAAQADIAAGKVVVEAQCVGCHGLDGRGVAPAIPDLAAQTERYLRASLTAYKEGTRTHAALHDLTSELTDAQIRNVAGYFASLPLLQAEAGEEVQAVVSPYEKGEAASQVCARCHGKSGDSTTAGIPSLAGQQPRYFISAVRAYLDGRRSIEGQEMLRELSHVDIEALALYYATQTPARREAPGFGDPVAGEPLSARCGGCHGARGVSHDTSTPSLAGQDPEYLVKAIKAYRDQTRQHSVMLDENTDEEIENLAAFYAVQESMAAESAELAVRALAEKCDICHGEGVEQPALIVPKIAGQDRAYLINALRAYRDGKRGSSMMHNMSLPYSEAIIESVASHYAGQPAR